MMPFIQQIELNLPQTAKELKDFWEKSYKNWFKENAILPVALEIGILLDFCAQNSIELSFALGDLDYMRDVILEALKGFEETIVHYS